MITITPGDACDERDGKDERDVFPVSGYRQILSAYQEITFSCQWVKLHNVIFQKAIIGLIAF